MGKGLKLFFIIAGILAVLAVCGNMYKLKDPNQPRVPVPTQISVPHVQVK